MAKQFHCPTTWTTLERLAYLSKRNGLTGCLEWMGAKSKAGYGQLWADKKVQYTHRLSYKIHKGPIPKGMCVCHTCDNRQCIEPRHLFLGTINDNNQDMIKKGRARKRGLKGTENSKAKLTEQTALCLFKEIGKYSALAKKYGISRVTVKAVKNKRTWKHIHDNP